MNKEKCGFSFKKYPGKKEQMITYQEYIAETPGKMI